MKTHGSYFRHRLILMVLLTIAFGITSCETNTDSSSEKLFESRNISPGGTFSFSFPDDGTYDYYCRIHAPNMQGTVTVSASANISSLDTVRMNNTQFIPDQIAITPDTEIIWLNEGNEVHTVVSGNPPTSGNGGY